MQLSCVSFIVFSLVILILESGFFVKYEKVVIKYERYRGGNKFAGLRNFLKIICGNS